MLFLCFHLLDVNLRISIQQGQLETILLMNYQTVPFIKGIAYLVTFHEGVVGDEFLHKRSFTSMYWTCTRKSNEYITSLWESDHVLANVSPLQVHLRSLIGLVLVSHIIQSLYLFYQTLALELVVRVVNLSIKWVVTSSVEAFSPIIEDGYAFGHEDEGQSIK